MNGPHFSRIETARLFLMALLGLSVALLKKQEA